MVMVMKIILQIENDRDDGHEFINDDIDGDESYDNKIMMITRVIITEIAIIIPIIIRR